MRNLAKVLIAIILLGLISFPNIQAFPNIKSKVYLSPKFELRPGSVAKKYFYGIDFPRGHISLKSFNAEIIDEAGNSIPLHEVYLHHWLVERYYRRKDAQIITPYTGSTNLGGSDYILARNDGVCQGNILGFYYGHASDSRGTATDIPDPYGIEIGNLATIPDGYDEEIWMLNVHAIDTRGVEDRSGCTECRCDLYNVTVDPNGQPIRPGYRGGLSCCYDGTQCRVKHGFEGASWMRSLYFRYTVKWVDWDTSILPIKVYVFDVTDNEERIINDSEGRLSIEHHCLIEYQVEACNYKGNGAADDDGCVHTKRTSVTVPSGGYIIYGFAHQHSGSMGASLFREDGQLICSSNPTYGNGNEAGNEAGYIVRMSTCYPKPGSLKITDWETLTVEFNYSSSREHTGVMGIFRVFVADRLPESSSFSDVSFRMNQDVNHFALIWGAILVLAVLVTVAAVSYPRRKMHRDGYQFHHYQFMI